jgi:DNA-binding MarR family transcriptional regulator
MDLKPLLVIIRCPGLSIKNLAHELRVTDRHASKVAIALHDKGTVENVRSGKKVLLYPDGSSPITQWLIRLEEMANQRTDFRIKDVIDPANNLRLVNVLATAPMTVNQVVACLEVSRPTFYRMLKGFGREGCGLVDSTGKREKEYFLDKRNPLHQALVGISRAMFGEVKYPLDRIDFRKLHLTSLRPRILIYLSSYLPFSDSFVVPTAITQQGLARSLWTTQPIISKELKRLISRGLVTEKRQHVKNEKRMYKTYHLTPVGLREVERLKTMIEGTKVPVVDFNGIKGERPLSEVPPMFSMRVRTVEVLNYLCQEDLLNFNQFQKLLGSKRESEFISVLYRLPGLKYFFGREGERNAFKKWLDSEASRVFLLKGIAGMGKTTYLTKVIQENKQRWNIFFYSIKEWSTPRNIISHIGHFLERLKKTSVSSLLENRGDFNIDESILLLEEPIKDTRTLMIFDDIQKADERIIQFFRALVGSDIVQDVKLVLAGRELTDIGQTNVEEIFTGLELKGLERSPSKQLLASRGIPKSKFDTIYDYTGGHPLALELVETKNGMPDMNLKMFIREEIVPKLSGPETEILRFVSIFRYPLTADALLPEHGGEEETTVHGTGIPLVEKLGKKKKWASEKRKISRLVDRLVKRSFLIYNGDSYYLHDIFRDFFYKRMDAGTRKRFHLLASKHVTG